MQFGRANVPIPPESTPASLNADNLSQKSGFIDGLSLHGPCLTRQRPHHLDPVLGSTGWATVFGLLERGHSHGPVRTIRCWFGHDWLAICETGVTQNSTSDRECRHADG